jgi:hypothetical protein
MRATLFVLGTWFCLALAVGISGSFESTSAPFVAGTVWILTALGLLACWKVDAIREWIKNVDLRSLISLHLLRFVGIYFLILCRNGELSCAFAKPAGIGDIVTAIGAGVLLALSRRGFQPRAQIEKRPEAASTFPLLAWNAFGLLDIAFVAFSALRTGLVDWRSMAPLRSLPLSLLPMFFVPLIIVSHILIFIRLLSRRRFQPRKRSGQDAASPYQ